MPTVRSLRSGFTTEHSRPSVRSSLRCGQLTASDGTVLDGATVCFEPGELELLPARSSRAVLVSLVAGSPPPGIYRGMIQADGAPNLWVPFEVAIASC